MAAEGTTPVFSNVRTGERMTVARALADGSITNTKLADMAQQLIKARKTLSTGAPEDCTLSEVLDFIGAVAQGSILYRDTSNWNFLAAGTSGQVLQTNGVGANPSWATIQSGANRQVFTSSGTWTKPATGTVALIQCWGGGGSGGRGGNGDGGGGGGGGAYIERFMALADLGSTETVTIGSGGAAVITDNTNGNAGNNTTFGAHVTAYGGGGGNGDGISGCGGGGGGGATGAGGTAIGANNGTSGIGYDSRNTFQGGVGGMGGDNGVNNVATSGDPSVYGGGGGGGGESTGAAGRNGGASMWGGAGGGGASDSGTQGSGGTSLFGGGNGGAANNAANNATAGTQPGGGGGGSESGNSGAGGDGQVIVTVW